MKDIARPLTRTSLYRYWSGMTSFSVWGMTLVALTVAGAALAGCGDTSNFVGDMPENGGSGGTKANAGSSSGGTTSHAGATSTGGTTSHAGSTSVAGTGSGGTSQGGTGAGGTSSQGGTGTGGTDPGDCAQLSGNWIRCGQGRGVVHRTAPGKCDSKLPHADAIKPIDPQLDECTKDTECTAKPNGFCAAFYPGFIEGQAHNYCAYGCTQDADCADGQVCQCGTEIGACVSARDCKSDQDCQGGLCAQYDACPGVPSYEFACQKPGDQCASDAQCQQSNPNKQFCTVTGNDQHRECVSAQCAI
ncbi:MAG TPA: hypothetical protein VHB79_26800 [Polyangiaceae bacterium]|nr:hypothetical protein [Polyangiaceae bacterium]